MSLERMRELYGEEYPEAVSLMGFRMPLEREGRFSRVYFDADRKVRLQVSRFEDGTASMTLDRLREEWPGWSDDERGQFCQASDWLHGQRDFPDILRFVMRSGAAQHWSGVALSVASALSRDEASDLLCEALSRAGDAPTANLTQAIAATGHPGAAAVLRDHLEVLWRHPRLWSDDPFLNWPAYDASCCIAHLLELGASPQDFEEKVRRLADHPCRGNRESCARSLHERYDWLPTPPPPPGG